MRQRRRMVFAAAVCVFAAIVADAASVVAAFTPKEGVEGLKAALVQAAGNAIATLGKQDGFLADPAVRIALPGKLQKARKTLRKLGLRKQTDALELTMNRAAEASVPAATELLMQSISQMSVSDALAILNGADNAATEYFRSHMAEKLADRFMPIVSKATSEMQLTERYSDVASRASALGLIDPQSADLDAYVTRKALDGLFLVMAREEAAIRKDPLGQASALLRKVFGSRQPPH